MIGVPLPAIKGKDAEMELLLVIAAVAVFVLLVKHTKAKGHISEPRLNLKARQNETEDLKRELIADSRGHGWFRPEAAIGHS